MKFTKMHGTGNDYIYVDGFREKIDDAPEMARKISDRHFGVGSDGLIIIGPSDRADFRMEMYNADGSAGMMCGNGIRCVAKYVYDKGMIRKNEITVDTLSGVKTLQLFVEDGKVSAVRVDMGAPVLNPEDIPVDLYADSGYLKTTNVPPYGPVLLDTDIRVTDTRTMKGTCVSMGNPHCVVPVPSVQNFDVSHIGPLFENNPVFPERVNTEFIRVRDRSNVQVRVWERGSGETYSCGTGACATAVACILNGWTGSDVTVHLLGGDLKIEWDRAKDTVYLTGPAVTVFEGTIEI